MWRRVLRSLTFSLSFMSVEDVMDLKFCPTIAKKICLSGVWGIEDVCMLGEMGVETASVSYVTRRLYGCTFGP